MPTTQNIAPLGSDSYVDQGDYRPGVCNIGPAEIARRRMAGHYGLLATVAVLAVLLLAHGPSWTRLVVALPAAASAVGYLQAAFHFCAGFANRGVYNFGGLGTVESVAAQADRARDRRRALEISLASLLIGVAVAIAAWRLPL